MILSNARHVNAISVLIFMHFCLCCKHMNAGCGKCWSIYRWELEAVFYTLYDPVEVNIPGIAVNIPYVCSKEAINSKPSFCKKDQ